MTAKLLKEKPVIGETPLMREWKEILAFIETPSDTTNTNF
jgi:hypothetical protein